MCVNGDWSTVNHYHWDYLDASVVCREVGHSPLGIKDHTFYYETISHPVHQCVGAIAFDRAAFGQGSGPVVRTFVSCRGYEESLTSCLFFGYPDVFRNHSEDVGVRCKPG